MKVLLILLFLSAGLGTNSANAGPLAPVPDVVVEYGRDFLERSGSQTLEELLDTGIIRYFLTGGQQLLVLVNGRPYATTAGDLDPLPISAIDRIQILRGGTLGAYDGNTALNVVLRSNLDGFEARTVIRQPSRDGGDGRQGSVFWGGKVGEGRMTLGVDILDRAEITGQSREYSRSVWPEGGAFRESKNVSPGGNTVWITQRDGKRVLPDMRSVALGECDPENGYTGPLSNPPGVTTGDKGCGFAYGRIAWNTSSYEQKSMLLNLDHPLDEGAKFHLDANFMQSKSAYRYAPSVGVFSFTPNGDLLDAINDAAGGRFVADYNDFFVVGHRFVAHGNRDWLTDNEEIDLSADIEGPIAENLGYDARLSFYKQDGLLIGNTFVHAGTIRSEILAGNYDLENPFSQATEHLQAIENSSLQEENDFGQETLKTRFTLEGSGFAPGGRNSAWSAGLRLGRTESRSIMVFRSRDGMSYDVAEVLGSGGVSYAGERKSAGAFAEISLPLTENLDLRAAGRGDELDDVGGLGSWSLGANYRPSGPFSLRAFWTASEKSPSMWHLYSEEVQDHPYILCDPGSGSPPRSCSEFNPRQVTRVTAGNQNLDPSENERIAIGAGARRGFLSMDLEWYQLSRSGLPGQNSADWAMENLQECMDGEKTDCIERIASEITIYNGYANIVESDLEGINTRIGWGTRTSWGIAGLRGAWRHITNSELHIAGEEDRFPIPRDVVRIGFLAKRGDLTVTWSANYRSGYENRSGTGTFDSWTGHDLAVDWANPLGIKGSRFTAGVFNLTDADLSVNTANPSSVDGPTQAEWGRTFFLTFNLNF